MRYKLVTHRTAHIIQNTKEVITVVTFDVLESNIFPDNMKPVSEEIFEKKGI